MIIEGEYHSGLDTRKIPATLILAGSGAYKLVWEEGEYTGALATARVSARLANIPRHLFLENGARFTTADNDAIDRALVDTGLARKPSLIHRLEDSPGIVLAALALLSLSLLLFFQYGIPALAQRAAALIPPDFERTIGQQSIEVFDRFFVTPTELGKDTQHRIRVDFNELIRTQHIDRPLTLLFRKGARIGPNAFALPGGYIVITDELVKLADNRKQLMAVLGHELGHVINRHAVRRIVENSAITLVIFTLTSDTNTVMQAASTFPYMLISNKYSRDYELEADRYALQFLERAGIDPENYAAILRKLQAKAGDRDTPGFLSTHPPTVERIKLIEGGMKPGSLQ